MFDAIEDIPTDNLFEELRRRGYAVVGFAPVDAVNRYGCAEEKANGFFDIHAQNMEDTLTEKGWDFLDTNWRN